MAQGLPGYDVVVHPRIEREHGISEEDIMSAWETCLPLKRRDVPRNGQGNDEFITIGFDTKGRPVELVVALYTRERFWLIYHGVRPATRGFVAEYEKMGGR